MKHIASGLGAVVRRRRGHDQGAAAALQHPGRAVQGHRRRGVPVPRPAAGALAGSGRGVRRRPCLPHGRAADGRASTASARADVTVSAVGVPLGPGVALRRPRHRAGRPVQRVPREAAARRRRCPADPTRAYASMGNYLFDPEVLEEALLDARRRGDTDFGRDVLPRLCASAPRLRLRLRRQPGARACRTTRSPPTGATSARSPRSPPRSRTRWAARRASTCGTAAGRSAASSTPPCSPASATGAKKRWPSVSVRRRRGKPRVEIGVATSGCSPAEVAPHRGALHLAPAAGSRQAATRAPHRRRQRRGLGALEQKSGFPVQRWCRPARRWRAPPAACRSAGCTSGSGRRARSATASGTGRRPPRSGARAPRRSRSPPPRGPGWRAASRGKRALELRVRPCPATASCAGSAASSAIAAAMRSTPFWCVRRPTKPSSGMPRVDLQVQPPLQRLLVERFLLRATKRRSVAARCASRGRIPVRGVDAVQDAGQRAAPLPQQAVQPAAELLGLDLARIGRADRGERAGVDQAALEERHLAVEFELLHGEGFLADAQPLEPGTRSKLPWNARLWMVSSVGTLGEDRRQRRRPVVAMDHVVARRSRAATRDEHAEAQRVVGPVLPAGILVGPPLRWYSAGQSRISSVAAAQQPALEAELAEALLLGRVPQLVEHTGIARQQNVARPCRARAAPPAARR